MQDNFAASLAFTLQFEGGKVNDPRDPGGRTNQGVTQRTYDGFRRGRGQPLVSVYAMTPDERDAIYASGFWNTVGAGALPAGVDLAAFDYGVNSGPARARKALPPATMTPEQAVRAICAKRSAFLHGLRTWATFGRGWARRVAACEALGVRMAMAAAGQPHQTALAEYADDADAKAKTAKTGAQSAAATAAVTPAASTADVSWLPIAVVALVLLLVVALFAWRAMHQRARAEAYADQAEKG